MRFKFQSKKLECLYIEEEGAKKYGVAVVDAFFDIMSIIEAAKDIRTLYQFKSLRFEKLSGNRKHQRSIRLNKQWRLIVEVLTDEQGNLMLIIDIEDYH